MKKYCILLFFAAGCHYMADKTDAPLVSIQIQDRNGLTETISVPERLEAYRDLNFLGSQPYKKILRVFKRDNKMAAKITTYYPNGGIWQYLESQDMRAFGAYREWHANGVQKVEATVIGGSADVVPGAQQDWLFDGIAKIWDEQGRLQAVIPYEKGVLQGHSIFYFQDGRMQREAPYINNELDGELIEYFSSGNVLSRTFYRRGLKHGVSIGLWPSGQNCWEEEYQDGLLLNGRYTSNEGNVITEVKSGFGYQTIFKDLFFEKTIEYRGGRPQGVVKIYRPNGELKTKFSVKNGRKQGEEIEYYASKNRMDGGSEEPLPKLSIPWESDVISGIVKTWYSNGKLQSQREFSRNKKTGSSLAWYLDGSLMLMEEYEEGRLISGQYYKKSQKEPVSTISNGNGVAMIYDEKGSFLRKIQYLKGKAVDPED